MDGFDVGVSEVVSKSASDGLGLVCDASGISNIRGREGLGLGTAASGVLNLVERGTLGLGRACAGVLNLVLGGLAGGVLNLEASEELGPGTELGFGLGGDELNLVASVAAGELNLDAREPELVWEEEEVVSLEAKEEPGLDNSGVLNLVPWTGVDFDGAATELKRVARGGLDFILGVMPGELEGVLECLVMAAPGKGSRGRLMRSTRSWNKESKNPLYQMAYSKKKTSNTDGHCLLMCLVMLPLVTHIADTPAIHFT